jgi:quinoprotein glucose dehydrogenase
VRKTAATALIAGGVFAGVQVTGAQQVTDAGQWLGHGGDKGATRYSRLEQIHGGNVGRLQVAWRRPAVAEELRARHPGLRYSNTFRSTPLMLGGVLYASNGIGLVEAFDPATGATLWTQELAEQGESGLRGSASRSISFWRNSGETRLFAVRGPYLMAIDASSGRLIGEFGERGKVDLRVGLADAPVDYSWSSGPLVVNNVVVVGSTMSDEPRVKKSHRGDVRAYDVRTGKPRWTFRVVPQAGENGVDTWEGESWKYTGHANAWTLFSADEELGYVYLPLSSPTSDMYGGHRLGANLFSDSIVCVRADTGERVWHFQTVHHDLWDYDLPAPPILGDIVVGGKPVKAAVQLTKSGFVFVFDRVTGRPVWPIEERAVPASTTPGEKSSPTQPFPTRPAPFERQGISEEDLIDFTPELRAEAKKIVERYVRGPLFTPPSLKRNGPNDTKGTLQLPGSVGGANWGGGAFDPETGVLYVPSVTGAFAADLVEGNPEKTNLRYLRGSREFVVGPQGLPLTKPPYGRITAIDLKTGEHKWVVPNGEGPRQHPAIRQLNLPPLGQPGRTAPLLTKTLLFVGEGDPINGRTPPGGGGRKFRAYDKNTGAVVWETELPAGTTGAPMTYMHQGKQYIVVAVGAAKHQAEFLALGLP